MNQRHHAGTPDRTHRGSLGRLIRTLLMIIIGGSSTAQAQSSGAVGAWGAGTNDTGSFPVYGQSQVPVAAQSEVTAIAAGYGHTVALIGPGLVLPSLHARPGENKLILSWPADAVGFALQSTLDLTPPVNWMDSPHAPVVIGAQFTVTNIFSGSARFYRLRKL